MVAWNLTDEQHHGAGVLLGHVHADAGVCRTRSAGDHANAGLAGESTVGGCGHCGAAFLPGDDDFNVVGVVVQPIDHRQVAFARHPEHARHTAGHQLFDERVPTFADRAVEGTFVFSRARGGVMVHFRAQAGLDCCRGRFG